MHSALVWFSASKCRLLSCVYCMTDSCLKNRAPWAEWRALLLLLSFLHYCIPAPPMLIKWDTIQLIIWLSFINKHKTLHGPKALLLGNDLLATIKEQCKIMGRAISAFLQRVFFIYFFAEEKISARLSNKIHLPASLTKLNYVIYLRSHIIFIFRPSFFFTYRSTAALHI